MTMKGKALGFLAGFMIVSFLLLAVSCGNSWEVTKKKWKSDYGNLERKITVYNINGDVVWDYSGSCYITESSSNGNLTVIYYVDNIAKKADFFGNMLSFVIIEL